MEKFTPSMKDDISELKSKVATLEGANKFNADILMKMIDKQGNFVPKDPAT